MSSLGNSNECFENKTSMSPIGILDSGIGGLTVLKAVCNSITNEDVIYFGDTNRVPYGQRSKHEIVRYATEAINFLKSKGVKIILIACGTVTSYISDIKDIFGKEIPILGIIESAAQGAVNATRSGNIGIMCTPVSAKVGLYEKNILNLNPNFKVHTLACPILAPLIESGFDEKNYKTIDKAAEAYVRFLNKYGVDTIILGCTHYPIIKDIIKKYSGDDVSLIDPGEEVAYLLKDKLEDLGMKNKMSNKGEVSFFVSGDIQKFGQDAKYVLGLDYIPSVGQVDIEKY